LLGCYFSNTGALLPWRVRKRRLPDEGATQGQKGPYEAEGRGRFA